MTKGRVGMWVKLKQPVRCGRQKAQITRCYGQGSVVLSSPLDGFSYWHASELQRTTVPKWFKDKR